MQHKDIKHYCSTALKNKWFGPFLGVFVVLGLLCSTSIFAEDLLKGAMPALKENFGTDSIVFKMLILAEILTSVLIFIKTKDFKIAGGVLFVLIFMTFTLNQLVFKSV